MSTAPSLFLYEPPSQKKKKKTQSGMLRFHDTDEVKTWQCVAGSL